MDERKWKSISNEIKKWSNTYLKKSQRNERWNTLQHSTKLWTTSYYHHQGKVPNEVDEYYQHSKYVIDPCKFKFSKVSRILSLRFIKILWQKSSGKAHTTSEEQFNTFSSKQRLVTEEEIHEAQEYFFRKATLERKHFLKKTTYKNITEERKGILYYTGRILPTSAINAAGKMTATMLDLSATKFYLK